MKLLFLRFVLLFALLSFTGCNLIDENFKDEPDFTVLTGVLSAQDPGDEYEGSHLLTDSEGTVFPVRSNMINLGAAQYLDNGVELTGVLNSEDDVFGVTGIKVVEILSDIRVTMAKFQEYKNTELGFRLKYYEDWTIREEEGKVIFFSPEESESQETMEISQSLFPYQPALDEDGGSDTPLEAYFKSQGWFDTLAYTEHQIGPDKVAAWSIDNSVSLRYYLYRAGLIYEISISSKSDFEVVFAEMFSEFRFVGFGVEDDSSDADLDAHIIDPPGPTAELPELDFELTTFESLPYLFSGQYPSSWYYAGSSGSGSEVLRHYGFGDEPLDESNEILSLDVISSDLPTSATTTIGGRDFVEMYSARGTYTVYTSVGNRNYRLSGPDEYQDLLLTMAASISPLESTE